MRSCVSFCAWLPWSNPCKACLNLDKPHNIPIACPILKSTKAFALALSELSSPSFFQSQYQGRRAERRKSGHLIRFGLLRESPLYSLWPESLCQAKRQSKIWTSWIWIGHFGVWQRPQTLVAWLCGSGQLAVYQIVSGTFWDYGMAELTA